jgi:hypothetical protein
MTSQHYLVAVWIVTNFLGAAFTIRRVYSHWGSGARQVSQAREQTSSGRIWTWEEARAAAIAAGALRPQGFAEGVAANLNSYQNYRNWSETPRAQARLEAWTRAIMDGVDPNELRSNVG